MVRESVSIKSQYKAIQPTSTPIIEETTQEVTTEYMNYTTNSPTTPTFTNNDMWLQISSFETTWINSTLDFIDGIGFDGIDLNPKNEHDLENYWTQLEDYGFFGFVKDLQRTFAVAGKLVTFTAVDEEMLKPDINVNELCNTVDYVHLQQFNIPPPLNGFNSHVTLATVKDVTETWIEKGCQNEKITVGFSTFSIVYNQARVSF